MVLAIAACSSAPAAGEAAVPDAASIVDSASADAATIVDDATDAAADASADVDAAPPVLKRFSGHVEYNGPVTGATVTLLAPSPAMTTTDTNGDFFFYAPVGSAAIVKVEATDAYPMIRGVVVKEPSRIRVFYLAGPAEAQAAQAIGRSFDLAKGIVEVDFRNAAMGGYTATMKNGGGAIVTPAFGLALDANGDPVESQQTITGGDGSTLLFGDVPPDTVSFTAIVPDAGALPCQPCDAPALPVHAGVVTWFDFECGSATDCQ